jgi:plastocyanin
MSIDLARASRAPALIAARAGGGRDDPAGPSIDGGGDEGQVYVVMALEMTFQPANLTIAIGDTVRWEGVASSHTVTSGAGSEVADAGELFEEDLLQVGGTFEFTFDDAGTIDYFCRFHEFAGMTGSVNVVVPQMAVKLTGRQDSAESSAALADI